jgi:hypothetical protein
MSDTFLDTVERLEPAVHAEELEDCEKIVVEQIEHLARPFDVALEVNISNDPFAPRRCQEK